MIVLMLLIVFGLRGYCYFVVVLDEVCIFVFDIRSFVLSNFGYLFCCSSFEWGCKFVEKLVSVIVL